MTEFRAVVSAVASILLLAGVAHGAEIHVLISGGFSAAYRNLTPEFERTTRNVVVTARGPSMGDAPQAIPNRLRRGEPADVFIMVDAALDELIKQGKVIAGSPGKRMRPGRLSSSLLRQPPLLRSPRAAWNP